MKLSLLLLMPLALANAATHLLPREAEAEPLAIFDEDLAPCSALADAEPIAVEHLVVREPEPEVEPKPEAEAEAKKVEAEVESVAAPELLPRQTSRRSYEPCTVSGRGGLNVCFHLQYFSSCNNFLASIVYPLTYLGVIG